MSTRTSKIANISLKNAKSCCNNGNFGRSFAHYLLYLKLAPEKTDDVMIDFVFVMRNWTEQLERENRIEDLFRCYEQACEIIPDCEVILNNIGAQLFRIGYLEEAAAYVRKSLEINPNYSAARENLDNICCHLVERWHFRMLNDVRRNIAYQTAIQRVSKLGHTSVLDMGAGTGILSMFARKAKFKNIYACERSRTMCDLIEKILVANNCEEEVMLIPKNSTELILGKDIPERLDLLVTETFDAALFGEHVIPSLIHAWDNILNQESGKVIPERATVYVCAIECEKLRLQNRFLYPGLQNLDFNNIHIICNTSHSLDEPYSTENLHNMSGQFKFLSEPTRLSVIDFNDIQMLKTFQEGVSFEVKIPIKSPGKLDALAVWFDLHLFQDISITTSPSIPNCWEQAIFPIIPSKSPNSNTDEKGSINQKEGDRIISVFSLHQNRLHIKSWQKTEISAAEENRCHNSSKEEKVFYMDRIELYRLNNLHLNRMQCKSLTQIKTQCPERNLTLLDFSSMFSPISLQMGRRGYQSGTVVMKSEFHELYQTLLNTNELVDLNYDVLDVSEWPDLTRKHDIILCDPVELCGALRQQIFEDLDLLKLTCLEEDGRIVPGIIRINAMCIESESLLSDSAVLGNIVTLGLHIAEFINGYQAATHLDVDLHHLDHVRLTAPFQLFQIDLNEKCIDKPSSFLDLKTSVSVTASDTGHVTAVIYWFEFELCEGITLSTLDSVFPWNQAAVMMKACDLDLVCGQQVKVHATLKNSCIGITIDDEFMEGG
ncbi:protein arginine N-methyltransferase 9-like [Saccostrea cucullata]|uniref:protein arginine N-methyltransferase 9-like n=1 Tax=Saccostrea cuccullata TaxID=36930 RepID=UPI002ED0605A